MAEAGRAVFLSYASQDAEAVARIAEALRAAGVEVWFDRNELVGGDAWDAKIRGQIAACALFVPVISANTQARREGYFRLEWKLGAQRTHAMADDRPFLLPVVIDDTTDAAARVPPEFRAVQWTRLAGGAAGALEKFCARMGKLLGRAADPVGVGGGDFGPASSRPAATKAQPARRWLLPAAFTVLFGVALALWQSWETPPPASSPAVTSPAREWVTKARALYEPWDLATHEDFKQAEQFLDRALALDPSDSEAWAARAVLSCGFYVFFGGGQVHSNRAMGDAERAVKLAPASDYARIALAYAMRFDRETEAEALKNLRELLVRQPNDKFVLRILGVPLSRRAETAGEGLGLLARAAAQPGGDPIAEYIQGESMIRYLDRETEGLGAIDRALALAPNYADAHCERIVTLLERRGDLEAAGTALAQVPPALLRDERVMAVAVKVWLAANDPERALRALSPAGATLAATYFKGPTGYLKGMAHRRAGRLPAAQAEWRVALQEVQRRLGAAPTDPFELLWKACLSALVGEAPEARAALDLARQFSPGTFAWNTAATVEVAARAVLTPDDALDGLSRTLSSTGRRRWQAAARIVFDPALDHLRNDPKFAALVEQAKAYYAEKQAREAKNSR